MDDLEQEINTWLEALSDNDEVKRTNIAMTGEDLRHVTIITIWWGPKSTAAP
jgi:hypothetical protein